MHKYHSERERERCCRLHPAQILSSTAPLSKLWLPSPATSGLETCLALKRSPLAPLPLCAPSALGLRQGLAFGWRLESFVSRVPPPELAEQNAAGKATLDR